MAAIIKVLKRLKNTLKTGSTFLRAVFINEGIYKYYLKDLWHGAWLLRCGYTSKAVAEKILDNDSKFMRVDINGKQIVVSKDIFKLGEMAWLYQETFGRYPDNPHSYLKGRVAIDQGNVVIDAGACEGFFVKLALEAQCGHVYAFEPLGVLAEGLTRTFHGDGRVEILSCGLSDGDGRAKMSFGVEYVCETKIDKDGAEEIFLTTIDAFVKARGLSRVDFIKMDIEGAEIKAIKGARNVLQQFAPKLAIAVYHKYDTAERLKDLILKINPDYQIEYSGCYMYERPFRPFLLYGYRNE